MARVQYSIASSGPMKAPSEHLIISGVDCPRAGAAARQMARTARGKTTRMRCSLAPPRAAGESLRGGGRRQGDELAHLLERLRLDLADALGRDLELGGEVVQRSRVLLLQPARLDDAAAARVEAGERALQAFGAQALRLLGFQR